QIMVESSAPVKELIPAAQSREQLRKELSAVITNDLLSGQREEMARAAYMAVCLDEYKSYEKKYPRQWKAACAQLSGYWKIMNNVFSKRHHFVALRKLQEKFANAGFKAPVADYTNRQLWNDKEIWKALDN